MLQKSHIQPLFLIGILILFKSGSCYSQSKVQMVRMAKIVVNPTQLTSYNQALTEEIEASIRLEPGVWSLYAVSEKEKPHHITILEIYADSSAYQAHIRTKHFLKYKLETQNMIESLELIEATPLLPDVKMRK
jgi:quinol monooxygenase YgiN